MRGFRASTFIDFRVSGLQSLGSRDLVLWATESSRVEGGRCLRDAMLPDVDGGFIGLRG